MTLPLPYGLSLVVPPFPQPPDRREYVDPNNQIQSSRLIDAVTRDFVLADNGHFVGQDVVKQQVYLSLLTYFDSSAQKGLGNQFFTIKLVTPNIINQCNAAVKLALANLINNKSISLNGVNVVLNGPGQVIIQVFWTENTTQTQQTTTLPVQPQGT
jgi:hypothetical protein